MEKSKSDLNMYKEKAIEIMKKIESDESIFFMDLAEYLTKRVN
jgi:hypothetical protein